MDEYDPKVIRDVADDLEIKARITTFLVIPVVAIASCAFGASLLGRQEAQVGAVIGFVVGAPLGIIIARSITMRIRLQAQILLCMAKIEENTRRP